MHGKYLGGGMGGVKVPIFDSTGTSIGQIMQKGADPNADGSKRHAWQFRLYNASGALVHGNDPRVHLHVEVETTPCMSGSDNPRNFALFALIQDKGPLSVLNGLRVIIHRSDLPLGSLDKHKTNDTVLDRLWVPCNKPSVFRHGVNKTRMLTYTFPHFTPGTDWYESGHAANSCVRRYGPGGEQRTDCGTTYANYIFPRSGTLTGFPNLVLDSATSTGIGGGGVGRAVFAVPSGGLSTHHSDEIRYVDHNVPCEHDYTAKWDFLRIGKVSGWLPRPDASFTGATSSDPYATPDNGRRSKDNPDNPPKACPTTPKP